MTTAQPLNWPVPLQAVSRLFTRRRLLLDRLTWPIRPPSDDELAREVTELVLRAVDGDRELADLACEPFRVLRYVDPGQLDPVFRALLPPEFVRMNRPRLGLGTGTGKTSTFVWLLQHWSSVSTLKPGQAPARSIMAAGSVTRAALQVRRSLLHDPEQVSRRHVAEFTQTWLGRKATDMAIEDVGEAILFADLDNQHDNSTLVSELKRSARQQRRRKRLLTDGPFRRQRVESLDQLPRHDVLQASLVGTAASSAALDLVVETRLEAFDERIHRVLALLKPDERDVARAYAGDVALTWSQAAARCGHPSKFGERVQHKLRRLGKRLVTRTSAAVQPCTL